MPSFTATLKKELLSLRMISISGVIALLYLFLSVFLLNAKLFETLVAIHAPLSEILGLFVSLFAGLWTSLSGSDFILTLCTALLVGVNMALLIQTVYVLENKGKVRISIGGATLISLVATGCTSCGLSLISILGLSASLSFLPFHGMELHGGAAVLLALSALYMLRQLHKEVYCKIEVKKSH